MRLSLTTAERRRLGLALLAVGGLAALQFTFLRLDDSGSIAPDIAVGPPRYTVSGAQLTRHDRNGDPNLRGTAANVEYFDDESGRATTLHLDLIADGRPNWQLDTPTATLPAGQHRYLLEDAVQVRGIWPDTGEPVRVDSTQVWVDPDTRSFYSDTPVQVSSAARNGTAVGMRGDWLSHRLQLEKDVRMSYVVPR